MTLLTVEEAAAHEGFDAVAIVAQLLAAGATEVEVDVTRHGTLRIRATRGAPPPTPATAWKAR